MAGFILLIVFGALFIALNTGNFSYAVTSAKTDLQGEVRRLMDWIVKDVRQTSRAQINNNNPTVNHIKFQKVTGIDAVAGYQYSTDYVEYNYDPASLTLTRNELDASGAVINSWVFNNITQSPFYSDVGVPLVYNGVTSSNKLVLVIASQKQVRNNLTINFSLTEEAKIRNE